MDEIIISRGSGKSAIAYMIGLYKLYESGKISKIDYLSMKGAALTLMFGVSEEDVLNQIAKELEEDEIAMQDGNSYPIFY